MNNIFIIVTLMFLTIGIVAFFFADKDDKNKDTILPIQGTRFK